MSGVVTLVFSATAAIGAAGGAQSPAALAPGLSEVRCERSRITGNPGKKEWSARFEGAVVVRSGDVEMHGHAVEVFYREGEELP